MRVREFFFFFALGSICVCVSHILHIVRINKNNKSTKTATEKLFFYGEAELRTEN